MKQFWNKKIRTLECNCDKRKYFYDKHRILNLETHFDTFKLDLFLNKILKRYHKIRELEIIYTKDIVPVPMTPKVVNRHMRCGRVNCFEISFKFNKEIPKDFKHDLTIRKRVFGSTEFRLDDHCDKINFKIHIDKLETNWDGVEEVFNKKNIDRLVLQGDLWEEERENLRPFMDKMEELYNW